MDLTGFIFEGVLSIVVGAFGLLGNTTAIFYFGRRRSRLHTFQKLLQWLSIFDLTFILSVIIVFAIPKFYVDYDYGGFPEGSIFCIQPYILPLAEIGLTGSIYFTIAISIERYLVICRPFLHLSRSISSRAYIIPIVCFSIIFNIPHFFEWKMIQNYPEGVMENVTHNVSFPNASFNQFEKEVLYHTEATEFRRNESYYQIYWVGLTICFRGVIPYLALIILNTLVVKTLMRNRHIRNKASNNSIMMRVKRQLSKRQLSRAMSDGKDVELSVYDNEFRIIHSAKESRRRKTQIDLAKVSITIVAIFILCHSVKWIPNIYELLFPGQLFTAWLDNIQRLSHLLLVFNSSINFYIYMLKLYISERRCYCCTNCVRNQSPEVTTNKRRRTVTTYFES